MKKEMKAAIFNGFKNFPDYEFIVKMITNKNDSHYFEDLSNVHVFEWVDQKTILSKF